MCIKDQLAKELTEKPRGIRITNISSKRVKRSSNIKRSSFIDRNIQMRQIMA